MSVLSSPVEIDPDDYNEERWFLPLNLYKCLHDSRFWLSLITRLGFDVSVYGPTSASSIPSLDTLSRYFDSTQLGMMRVFNLFDKDHDDSLTFDEISRGLRQQGMFNRTTADSNAAFSELCSLLQLEPDEDVNPLAKGNSPAKQSKKSEGAVKPPAFLAALRNLRLAAVLAARSIVIEPTKAIPFAPSKSSSEVVLFIHEYREDRLFTRSPLDPVTA